MEGSAENLPRASTVPAIGNLAKTPQRTSTLPLPAGSAASDVASGSSNSQNTAQRPAPVGGPLVRHSTSQTLARTESSAIDPLSQHIIQRTNTQRSIPLKLLGRASYEEAGGSENTLSDQSVGKGDTASTSKPKEKNKNRVSLLGRIIGKKPDLPSEAEDETSDTEAHRMSTDQHHIGFIPRHLAPAHYVKVRTHYKKDKTFDRVFEAQELQGAAPQEPADRRKSASSIISKSESHGKALWALSFSKDGKYFAAAGQDRRVRIWAVITSPEEREAARTDRDGKPDEHKRSQFFAPVFQSNPIQVYEGHSGSVLDLSWSKNNFLLSSSMDKTVRLWHISRPECLCCFQHSDFVTSIQFHPRDDRFFLAGSLDMKLRLWSIPDKSVAFVTTLPDMITSVAFTPDGRHSMAGCLNGLLGIYDTEGLKLSGQIHARSARGRNSKGAKITGIDTIKVPEDDPNGDIKVLVTSNDSRIRLYDFRERILEAKFRGNENACSQIRASFTDDGKHVICGSEDRRIYVWPIETTERDAEKRPVEVFEAQNAMVTVAITAPTRLKQLLSLSEDPIYDICNPPPVNLASPEEAAVATKISNSTKDSKEESQNRRSESTPQLSILSKIAQESPAYISRSAHMDGNIILMADYAGRIKVFRQDCAYHKRRYENWDNSSTISRRFLRRSNSARNSIASSTGKESALKTPSERIISWRNSVVRQGRSSYEGSRPGLRSRSPSPPRRSATPVFRLSSSRPSSLGPGDSLSGMVSPPSSSPMRQKRTGNDRRENTQHANGHSSNEPNGLPASSRELPATDKTQENPLWLQGDHSYAYWQKITHDAQAIKSRKSNEQDLLGPNRIPSGSERKLSTAGSILSSDCGSSVEDDDLMRCENCLGTNFRGVKDRGGKQKLICSRCNRSVS